MREKIVKSAKISLAIILSPIIFVIYSLDRAILLPLFWLPIEGFTKWATDNEKIGLSLLRLVTVLTIYGMYSVILFLIR